MPGCRKAVFKLSFLFHITLSFLLYADASSEIPLGSMLSVEENNYWLSSNGDFAVGFFNVSNRYSVGIHFNSSSIPSNKQTVVWVAGADLRVDSKSCFELTQDGELVLFDSGTGVIAWTSKTRNASVALAVLRDDGNLVLLNRNSDTVWQSFDTPSDTLLPGQNLSVRQMLRPPRKNLVSSYYSLFMNDSGQLQLRWETSVIYWTGGDPSESTAHATLLYDGTFQLLDQRSKSIWSVFGEDHNDSDVKFRYLRLDADGNLRLYSWKDASKSWRSVWQAFDNQCDVFATCGLRGICALNASGFHVCKCPFTSKGELNSKCLIPYQPDCESGSSMITCENTLLYGIYPPNDTIIRTNLQQCKNLCYTDPLCYAVSFTNNDTPQCRVKRTQYIGGKTEASLSSVSFVKTCLDPRAVLPEFPESTPSSAGGTQQKTYATLSIPSLVGISGGTVTVFLLMQFGICLYLLRGRKLTKKEAISADVRQLTESCTMLSYSEIRDFTENFKHQIGPKMFRGVFPNNKPIAVKHMDTGVDLRKFRSTVLRIGSIHHKNLVKLDGYCCESGHRFLVYEFVSKGSLAKCLEEPNGCKRLTWRKRMEICLTVAKAILYLHTGCREFVSHGNLKCENVVLDDNFEAKVTEFGLSSIVSQTFDIGGQAENDIRDFGKMVVVLISGRQNAEEEACLWAYEKWAGAQSEKVLDEQIEGVVNSDELERALRIAFWCLQLDERMRPSMNEVVQVLDGTLPVDPPPPFSTRITQPEEAPPSEAE